MTDLVKLLRDFQQGEIDRRRVLQALGLAATAFATSALPRSASALAARITQTPAGRSFPVTTVNHLSYASPDYKKTREFYVDLFGMRDVWDNGARCQVDCGPEAAPNSLYLTSAQKDQKAAVAHFSFGLPNYFALAKELKAELDRRGLNGVRPDGEAGWFQNSPSGWVSHIVTVKDPAMFPGAAGPCESARSDKCKAAYEEGLKDLASIPKASGRGFRALYFKYVILRTPDVATDRDFYASLMGMKVVSDKKDDVSLRFGDNTLVLRSAGAGAKPYCNEFGFVVENYDEAKVKAELARRGISSKPSAFGGLVLNDPNGFEIGIGGRG